MKTLRFRLKDKNTKSLIDMASSVNFVWNFCNQTSLEYLDKKGKWLTGYDLGYLTVGCSSELGLASASIEAVCQEYAHKRLRSKKRRLQWRSYKRSLKWVPFKACSVKVTGDSIRYYGNTFKFWKSRDLPGKIRTGCFSEDSKGNWFLNLVCDSEITPSSKSGYNVGIDLGLKTLATTSDGQSITRDNITIDLSEKLAMAQRARKRKRVTAIHQQIKNRRQDWTHKVTTQLVNQYDQIFVGDVSPSKLKKTRMAKSVSDAGWATFKSLLAYKAITLGKEYHEVKESFSTVTCSSCFERTGPSGLSALGVREWTCSCGASHDRDVNAAKNILRFGHESLKGATKSGGANLKSMKTDLE